jgi:hypothetical protein
MCEILSAHAQPGSRTLATNGKIAIKLIFGILSALPMSYLPKLARPVYSVFVDHWQV